MAEKPTVDLPGFAELDAMLDQALQLEGEDLEQYLGSLPASHRKKLEALLAQAESPAIEAIASAAVERAPRSDPSSAGRWQLRHELGSGGMGQVWFAVREEDGLEQKAAVKILWSHRAGEELTARFFRERRILAAMDHPGLARLLDSGMMADGLPWFAMEYVDGIDILSWAQGQSRTSRLEQFLAVCDALQYAHEQLVIHRDIKPANILVDSSGRPRLLDFGVAGIADAQRDDLLTGTGGSPVTLQYASPEQVTGGVVAVTSDVYQLGMLLYELLAGRLPCDLSGMSLQQAIETICEKTPEPPGRVNGEGGSTDLDAIVMRALRKDPSQRYRSVAALADDVRRFLAGHPVRARAPSLAYTASRFIRRNALATAMVSTVVITLSAATVISLKLAREARSQAERSQKAQEILFSVFDQADPYREGAEDGGGDIPLAQALVNARPVIGEQIQADPELAIEVQLALGKIYSSLGLGKLESEAYAAALEAAHALGPAAEARRMDAVAGLGNALVRRDPNQAVAFFDRELPPMPSASDAAAGWQSAKYSQINALLRLRNLPAADQAIGEMATAAQRYPLQTPRARGRLSQLLAGRASRADDREAADRHWQDAVTHMREAQNPFALAVMLSNAGIHLGRRGRFEESEDAFTESLAIFNEHSPEDPAHAGVLRTYAGLLIRDGRADEAVDRLNQSAVILADSTEHYERFVVQLNLATYALLAGRFTASFQASAAGLELALESFGAEAEVTQRLLTQFARLLAFAGAPEDAVRLAQFQKRLSSPPPYADSQLADLAMDSGLPQLADITLSAVPADSASVASGLRRAVQSSDQSLLANWLSCAESLTQGSGDDARRGRIWVAIAAVASGQATHTQMVEQYLADQHTFFDPLDRWRAISAIARLAPDAVEAGRLSGEWNELNRLRVEAAAALREQPPDLMARLLGRFPAPDPGPMPDAAPPGCSPPA